MGDDGESVPDDFAVDLEDHGEDGGEGRRQPGPRSSEALVGGGGGGRRSGGGGGGGGVTAIKVCERDQFFDVREEEVGGCVRN